MDWRRHGMFCLFGFAYLVRPRRGVRVVASGPSMSGARPPLSLRFACFGARWRIIVVLGRGCTVAHAYAHAYAHIHGLIQVPRRGGREGGQAGGSSCMQQQRWCYRCMGLRSAAFRAPCTPTPGTHPSEPTAAPFLLACTLAQGCFQFYLYNHLFVTWCRPITKAFGHFGAAPVKTFIDQALQ